MPIDDIENNRISYFTNAILLSTISITLILSVIKVILPPKINLSDFIVWGLILLFILIYIVFRKGKLYLAGSLYVITLWSGMTILAWTFEGVRDIAIVAYIVAILIAMLITKPWQAILLSILSIISLWVIFYAENNLLIIPKRDTSINYSIEFTVILILITTLIYLNAKSFSSFYKRIQNELKERQLAEKALNKSEERYRDLVENINDVIFTLDTTGIITYTSPQVQSLFGYLPEELEGHHFSEIILPEDMPELERGFKDTLENRLEKREFRYMSKTGEIRWANTSSRPIYEGNRVVGVSGIFSDINEQKRAEDALSESKDLLSSIIDSTTDLIWSVDSERYSLLTYNKGLKNFFTREGIRIGTGMLLHEILPPELADKLSHLYSETLKEGSLVTMYDTTLGKRSLWMSLNVLTKDKKPYAISVFAKDITDLMKAQQALIEEKERAEESDRLKTAFLNNISHEVRTPLNGILGFAQFIVQQDVTEEDKAYYLDILNASSERLLNTITDYMDISLIVSGNIKVNMIPVSLTSLLGDVYNKFETKIKTKNLNFISQINDENGNITTMTDPVFLEKAISHLVDNAIKFTNTGTIILGLSVKSNIYEIFVKDTGAGISEAAKGKIFDNFIQEEISSTRGYEGSGLGLSITRGLVDLLGGTIRLESKKNEGSVFYITIPSKEIVNREVESFSNSRPEPGLKKSPLILIADDDEVSVYLSKSILESASLKYLVAADGSQAVEKCHKYPDISLVLMDIKMPVMNGLEATKRIREFRKELPIIGVTAYAMTGDRERALDEGCTDYITKPLKSELLLAIINKYS